MNVIIKDKIREILLYSWDPIGFRGFPKEFQETNKDEYDIYIDDIVKLIDMAKSEEEFKAYLIRFQKYKMPWAKIKDNICEVSRMLFSLRK